MRRTTLRDRSSSRVGGGKATPNLIPRVWQWRGEVEPDAGGGLDGGGGASGAGGLPLPPESDQIAFLNFPDLYRSAPGSGDLQCKPRGLKTMICSHSDWTAGARRARAVRGPNQPTKKVTN